MNRRPQLIEALKISEGLRLSPYRDTVGKLSIGYGHNLEAKPLPWLRTSSPIPKRIAEVILDLDVDDALRALDKYISWWRDLDDVREQVLADMAFNMGVNADPSDGLDSFTNTLRAVHEGRWQDAKDGMLASKWSRQVGDRAQKLAEMMLTGRA